MNAVKRNNVEEVQKNQAKSGGGGGEEKKFKEMEQK